MQQKQTNARLVTVAVMMATFLTAIEGTVVSTAMPKIVSDLQGIELMNWVLAIYLLLSAVTIPIFGKLSDLFGRKMIFMIGTILFLSGSILCGLSQNMGQLIVFRALQGIGAGAIMPITTIIIGDVFPYEMRAKILGYTSMIWGIAGIIGPLVGGFFVDQITWHWIFYMNVPFGLIAMFIIWFSLHENNEKAKKSIDYLGTITFAISMLALLYGVQRGGEGEWTSPFTISLFVIAVIFLISFIKVEKNAEEPLIPLALFKNRMISISNLIAFLLSVLLIGMMVYIPMWMQGVLGKGATLSGFILAPMSLTWILGAFLGGKLLMSKGAKFTVVLGNALLLMSVLLLVFMGKTTPYFLLCIVTAMQGFGCGLVFTISTVLVQVIVPQSLRGVSTATITFSRTLGQTIGIALLGTYFNSKIVNYLGEASTKLTMAQFNTLLDPNKAISLSRHVKWELEAVLVKGIHSTYWVIILITVVAVFLAIFLPNTVAANEETAE